MPADSATHHGRCLCGRVRFSAQGDPKWVAHCHCESCRRTTASPYTTYAGFRSDRIGWSGEAPAAYESSPGVLRRFCGHCGTPLSYESDRWPGEVHFFVSNMDAPEALPPRFHVYMAEKLPWVHLGDDLPKYPGTGGGGTATRQE